MRIDGENVRRYGAAQLTVELKPPTEGAAYEWPDNALEPIADPKTQKAGTCTVVLLIRGENRNEIARKISEIHAKCLPGPVELELDGYSGKYKGWLDSCTPEKKTARAYKLALAFSGWFFDSPVKMSYSGTTQATIHRVGTRPAGCILTVTPRADLAELTMTGWGKHLIELKALKAGVAVVIDGQTGLITQAGKNKAQDVTIWALPAIDETEKTITWSSPDVDVDIEYTPRWL